MLKKSELTFVCQSKKTRSSLFLVLNIKITIKKKFIQLKRIIVLVVVEMVEKNEGKEEEKEDYDLNEMAVSFYETRERARKERRRTMTKEQIMVD